MSKNQKPDANKNAHRNKSQSTRSKANKKKDRSVETNAGQSVMFSEKQVETPNGTLIQKEKELSGNFTEGKASDKFHLGNNEITTQVNKDKEQPGDVDNDTQLNDSHLILQPDHELSHRQTVDNQKQTQLDKIDNHELSTSIHDTQNVIEKGTAAGIPLAPAGQESPEDLANSTILESQIQTKKNLADSSQPLQEEKGPDKSSEDKKRIEKLENENSELNESIKDAFVKHKSALHSSDEENRKLKKKIQMLKENSQQLNRILELSSADKTKSDAEKAEIRALLEKERKEKQTYIDEISGLKSKLELGNQQINNLLEKKQQLETTLDEQTYKIAQKWAQELSEILLTKLSVLAEKEPEPIQGLKPRSVYESLLDWLAKAFGERPKMFPTKKEYTIATDGKYMLTLDADLDGIQSLLKRYDWSPEQPFESKSEGQRHCQFKLMHWGWTVKDTILVRARVTTFIAEPQE